MSDETKKVQVEIKESVHKIWLAGLGALAAAEEEGAKVFNSLVERGEVYENRGKEELTKVKERVEGAIGKAESSWEKLGDSFDAKVAGTVEYAREQQGPILLLAWHEDAIDAIAAGLSDQGVAVIKGATNKKHREAALENFKAGNVKFLIGQIGRTKGPCESLWGLPRRRSPERRRVCG